MIDIDLNDFSGGPHWLSPLGKVDRAAIRAKHRAKWLAERPHVRKPARPEMMARLERTVARAKETEIQGPERAKTRASEDESREPELF